MVEATRPAKQWYEVWVDESSAPPYVLLVVSGVERDVLTVHDPREDYRVVFRDGFYEAVTLWLLEDEYIQIGKRREIDEWWDD